LEFQLRVPHVKQRVFKTQDSSYMCSSDSDDAFIRNKQAVIDDKQDDYANQLLEVLCCVFASEEFRTSTHWMERGAIPPSWTTTQLSTDRKMLDDESLKSRRQSMWPFFHRRKICSLSNVLPFQVSFSFHSTVQDRSVIDTFL
jgi:hypothetical protein